MLFLLLSLIGAPATTSPSLLTVTVTDTVEASVMRLAPTNGAQLSAEAARLLRWRGDLNRHVQRGDTLRMLYRPGATEPEVLALTYAGAELHLRAYKFAGIDGIERYYDEKGVLIEPVLINAPVPAYTQITETVQQGRGRRRHHGDDLKAPEGTPIILPFDGTVVRTNWARRVNGNCIEVAYQNGTLAHFLHLSRIDRDVRAGRHLHAGTPLGAVGSTGHSNAAHLHYEIIANGKPLEPLRVHGQRQGHLDGSRVGEFDVQRDAYDRSLLGPALSSADVKSAAGAANCVPLSLDAHKPLGCQP